MKHIKIYVVLTFLLLGCTTDGPIDTFPEDNISTENCAADGVGCKQYNKDLNR